MISTSAMTRTMLAANAIGRMLASMIALCSLLRRAMMYMNKVPSADRLYIECSPEQASATSIWYWPIVRTTPLRAIG